MRSEVYKDFTEEREERGKGMAMKKFINKPEDLVSELLEGYAPAYPNTIKLVGDNLVARAVPKTSGKVGIVTLGGSGHEPGVNGFIGKGLLDIGVPGEIFAAPGPPRCLEALKMADRGAGVLFVVLNHTSDVMTANLTMEMAKKEGLNVKMLLIHEDISSFNKYSYIFDQEHYVVTKFQKFIKKT